MAKMKTLADAFYAELQDVYSAEKQLVKALNKMAKHAHSEELQNLFLTHLEETKVHVERVESAFEDTGKAAKVKKCEAMVGLIKEADEALTENATDEVMDVIMVAMAQKVEHYEIATYGTLCAWAECLGYTKAKKLLGQNLQEEENTDQLLTEYSDAANQVAADPDHATADA